MERLFRSFIYSMVLTIITVMAVSLMWKSPLLLTLFLIVISAGILVTTMRKEDLLLYIFIAIAGALAEIIAIAFGAWIYTLPHFVGIPYWLPFLWGLAGILIKEIYLEINDFLKN